MQNPPPADTLRERQTQVRRNAVHRTDDQPPTTSGSTTTSRPSTMPKSARPISYAIDGRALERIYAGQIASTSTNPAAGHPGSERFRSSTRTKTKAKKLLEEARNRPMSEHRRLDRRQSPNDEAGEYLRQDVLKKLGFQPNLKSPTPTTTSRTSATCRLPTSTPVGPTGSRSPEPQRFFQPLLGRGILSTNNTTNLARLTTRRSTRSHELGEDPLGPNQEDEYAGSDKAFRQSRHRLPYGTGTLSAPSSPRHRSRHGHLRSDLRSVHDRSHFK